MLSPEMTRDLVQGILVRSSSEKNNYTPHYYYRIMNVKKVPLLKLPGTSDLQFNLSDYKGRFLVIYFYPKDATPGCTTQGVDFRDAYKKFQALDTEIFGISRDTLKSHENFKEKFTFPFELLSDDEEKACELFGVIKMKNMKKILRIRIRINTISMEKIII